MKKDDFERQINSLVLRPDREITNALFTLGQDLGEEAKHDCTQDLLNSLSFISRHFNPEITQGTYELIQCGAALPDEMVAAAFHMANCCDCTPQWLAQAATEGKLMCFHTPKNVEELSPLAVCAVYEDGKSLTCHTMHFGSFEPETALRSAQQYAHDRQTLVTDALLSLTVDMELNPKGGARKILVSGDEDMTRMLASCFNHYAALAAQLTFDVAQNQVSVEYNPLWLKLRQQQEQVQSGMAQSM